MLLAEGVLLQDLNDDGLGRALDKLQAADALLIFSLIASRTLLTAGVDTRFLHGDSTSRFSSKAASRGPPSSLA